MLHFDICLIQEKIFLHLIYPFLAFFSTFKQGLEVGFPIGIPLRAIVRNCAELRGIARSLQGSQLHASKSTCVGNPSLNNNIVT